MAISEPSDVVATRDAARNLGIIRALRSLELLAAEPKGMRITDVAGELRVNKAIAFRTLSVLVECGYVRQDAETQRYAATFKLAALGLRKLDGARLGEWAQEPLDRLAERTRELVRMAVVEDGTLRWIAKAQGSNSRLIVDPAAGADVVIHATATGKAWLSTLDDVEAIDVLRRRGLEAQTHRTTTDIGALFDDLALTRERGWAMTLEEMDPGINAIASPIVLPGSSGPGVGTVSLAGPAARLSAEVLERFADPLMETACEVAGQWGIYVHEHGGGA